MGIFSVAAPKYSKRWKMCSRKNGYAEEKAKRHVMRRAKLGKFSKWYPCLHCEGAHLASAEAVSKGGAR